MCRVRCDRGNFPLFGLGFLFKGNLTEKKNRNSNRSLDFFCFLFGYLFYEKEIEWKGRTEDFVFCELPAVVLRKRKTAVVYGDSICFFRLFSEYFS